MSKELIINRPLSGSGDKLEINSPVDILGASIKKDNHNDEFSEWYYPYIGDGPTVLKVDAISAKGINVPGHAGISDLDVTHFSVQGGVADFNKASAMKGLSPQYLSDYRLIVPNWDVQDANTFTLFTNIFVPRKCTAVGYPFIHCSWRSTAPANAYLEYTHGDLTYRFSKVLGDSQIFPQSDVDGKTMRTPVTLNSRSFWPRWAALYIRNGGSFFNSFEWLCAGAILEITEFIKE